MFEDLKALPRHVAVIMDGNGRWAAKRHMPRAFGHRAGMERVKDIVRWSSDMGIQALTLYAFSTENWKRPREEVGVLMGLLVEYLRRELRELDRQKVRFRMIGDMGRLPAEVQAILEEAIEQTRQNEGMTLCVAVNYGARAEIAGAAARLAEDYAAGRVRDTCRRRVCPTPIWSSAPAERRASAIFCCISSLMRSCTLPPSIGRILTSRHITRRCWSMRSGREDLEQFDGKTR